MITDKASYSAALRVESTSPRRVTIWVQFSHTTYQRLLQELCWYSSDKKQLHFTLTAKNLQTCRIQSDSFVGNVNLRNDLAFQCSLKTGCRYKFEVNIKKYSPFHGNFITFLTIASHHKEVLSKLELQSLMLKAEQFQRGRVNRQRLPVEYAYRNKPRFYFDEIRRNKCNIMEVYIKDNNG